MRHRTAALALAIVPSLLGTPLRAGEPSGAAPCAAQDLEAALQKLGPTPTADSVLALARAARFANRESALRFAGALLTHGGYACAHGLRALVQHRDPDVRVAALRGIAQSRIRVAEGMDLVRAARADPEPSARDAAFAAVGAVGDAGDVPTLLDSLSSDDAGVVAAAFAALRDLSGAKLRCRVVVWRQWWKETEAGVPDRLAKALTAVETGSATDDFPDADEFIARNAWVRLREVQDRVAAWIGAPDPDLRRAGYRFAADLRLGDVAERLKSAVAWEHDADCLGVGRESAKALGVAAPADRR